MSDLRSKIIQALESVEGYRGLEHERQADAILALPGLRRHLKAGTCTAHMTGTIFPPSPRGMPGTFEMTMPSGTKATWRW